MPTADHDARSTDSSTTSSGSDRKPVTPPHDPPEGATTSMTWQPDGQDPLTMTAHAQWTVLRREESPAAEMFSVAYLLDDADAGDRPVTFVFNGGPGASSAFLHVGAIGPRRIVVPDDGSLPAMPIRLVDNDASWMPWTDLVFIDPVGTGFSRRIPGPDIKAEASTDDERQGFYGFASDLAALREFISRWLSANRRWASPVFLAGESYGGYRTARLARSLPQEEGVGLAGTILISPALELAPLTMTDYSMEGFIDTLPTMAAAALHHGRYRHAADVEDEDEDGEAVMAAAASFAGADYVAFLAQGARMPAGQRTAVLDQVAATTGLDRGLVERLHGRVPIDRFARELLRDQAQVVGLYDATQTTVDPFPDRDPSGAVEHTLDGMTAAFTMGVNQVIRQEIGVQTERQYHLMSLEINKAWRADDDAHALMAPAGATDDLRFGLALNPHLRVLIVHGRHDLVTPLYTSMRLVDQMRLDQTAVGRVDLRSYDGGHMFYTLAASRTAFTADVQDLYGVS